MISFSEFCVIVAPTQSAKSPRAQVTNLTNRQPFAKGLAEE